MKNSFLLAAMLMILLIGTSAFGQTTYNPNSTSLFYTTTLASGSSYEASQLDTLPSPEAASPYLRIGGAKGISLTVTLNDTGNVVIAFQTRVRGSTSWTELDVAAGDTVTYANTATYKKEIQLRGPTLDRLGCIDCEFRIVNRWEASGQGVTTPTYVEKVNYEP
jgi:hypothetical protein